MNTIIVHLHRFSPLSITVYLLSLPPLRFSVTNIGSRLTKLDSDYNIRQVILITILIKSLPRLSLYKCIDI